jgi:hypothetical protein
MLQKQKLDFKLAISISLLAIILRIFVPVYFGLPNNFAPINSLALFSGARFRKFYAFIIPLLTIWLSDILINKIYFSHWTFFYSGFYWQYGSYLLITLIGIKFIKCNKFFSIITSALCASLLFFLISNFGVWLTGNFYPPTLNGLLVCYVAAMPFMQVTLVSDLFYAMLFFGVLSLVMKRKKMLALNLQ